MNAGTVLRKWREARHLTQPQFGRRAGASEWTIRAIETGLRPLPPALAGRAAQVLRAPEVAYAACESCPANLLLDLPDPERVDMHPMVQLVNALEEGREIVQALEGLDLRNRSRLEGPALAALERAADQLLDVVAAAAVALAVWSRQYGLDLSTLKARHRRKLELRGYVSREDEAAEALPRVAEGVAP